MDTTGHERLLLFRRVRIGFGFCGSCHPRFFASFRGCEEWISSHANLDVLGGDQCNASIVVAVLIV
jgi:hypothetical protein